MPSTGTVETSTFATALEESVFHAEQVRVEYDPCAD